MTNNSAFVGYTLTQTQKEMLDDVALLERHILVLSIEAEVLHDTLGTTGSASEAEVHPRS